MRIYIWKSIKYMYSKMDGGKTVLYGALSNMKWDSGVIHCACLYWTTISEIQLLSTVHVFTEQQ